MRVAFSLADAGPAESSVISIGNFDGLHLGHQAILQTVATRGAALGVRTAAVTFSPHPVHFLAPDKAPKLISTLEQKIRLIEGMGIDLLLVAKFDEAFSHLPPEEFIRQYIQEGLHARSICVGSNFNFGHRQSGTVETLKHTGQFEVIQVPSIVIRGIRVSSSAVRNSISAGRISKACRLLGRWFEIEGAIIPGAGRGRSLTVPTLNMKPDNELIPGIGVYATRVSIDGGPFVDSITNVGVRPTFGEHSLTVETYVLEGPVASDAASARLQFMRRLRDEKEFASPDALRRQIGADIENCRRFFRLLRSFHHAGRHSN